MYSSVWSRRCYTRSLATAVSACLMVSGAKADQLTLTPIDSGSVFRTVTGNQYGSSETFRFGQKDELFTADQFDRGYVWFSLAGLPEGATVTSARLEVDVQILVGGDPNDVLQKFSVAAIDRLLSSWQGFGASTRWHGPVITDPQGRWCDSYCCGYSGAASSGFDEIALDEA